MVEPVSWVKRMRSWAPRGTFTWVINVCCSDVWGLLDRAAASCLSWVIPAAPSIARQALDPHLSDSPVPGQASSSDGVLWTFLRVWNMKKTQYFARFWCEISYQTYTGNVAAVSVEGLIYAFFLKTYAISRTGTQGFNKWLWGVLASKVLQTFVK